ncbi:hypothetical protein B0I32_103381 [Nonomuraea fuscirosea]|uniref:DUF4350 domain-containing protein n=1 Tax=Nonomuraea fuscirosea TaxID=1291556 RepID=A0A2T0N7C2_9ACTN|nr:DUF4350 domain-containing protein [Nonomuraea fuscirosea]PRX68420.1 hypothetical protein B0I32_103381 [Nonomuraea fuscirosea]
MSIFARPADTGAPPQAGPATSPAPQGANGQGSYSTSPTARSAWRSSRLIVLLGVLVVLIAVIGVLLAPGRGESRPLDPDDTSLAGSKALAEILRGRGVTVERVGSAQAAAEKAAAGDKLLVITDLTYYDEEELARLPGDRLVVGPLPYMERVAPGVRIEPGDNRSRSREPECGLPAAAAAGSVHIGGLAMRGPAGTVGCFPVEDGHLLVRFQADGGVTTVVGDGSFMTNQRLAEDGNAALAINLLQTGKSVVWLARPADPPAVDLPGESGKSIYDLMPESIRWAIYMAIIAVAVAAFWRGRRLGPVVTEKLPVVVRAAETVEGRGRLYRARRARGRAAASLRAGTIDRLAPRLGLGSGAGQHEVVAAIAARTGQDAHQVGTALYGPPPTDDAGLVALAGYLDFIERQLSEL